ncbi:putative small subunit of serine palmitoyltransferase [Lupinus albus]|uniref:Putative small subunit of serine palmitoyltransferase n=1 Tax=Lupinus albus TaxID=3870 RepID=A0A6A4Q2V6_LUPAL|nr:putative small subunit of serine palmitoyltransferase [Lupinus albus]
MVLICSAMEERNWVQRKIYLYNVTFGLYMLDSWERYAFNALVIVLIWFVLRYFAEIFKSVRYAW